MPTRNFSKVSPLLKTRFSSIVQPRHLFCAAVAICILLAAPAARSQQATIFEAAENYSYIRGNAASAGNGGSFNIQGGNASFSYNLKPWLGLVQDYGAYRFAGLGPGLNANLYTFLFGPRLSYRRSRHTRWTPYAETLFGLGRVTDHTTSISAGENGFAAALGGGVDFDLTSHISIRAVEADYLPTRFLRIPGASGTQNNIRLSAGIVIHLGHPLR